MKKVLLFLFTALITKAYGQNEFAAAAFYNDLKKLYDDAQAGFSSYKGEKKASEYQDLQTEYKVKLMLPLADSGMIVCPNNSSPYAIFYFEPSRVRLKVDQRALNLQEAVLTAYGQPLYARTETIIVNNRPLTNTLLFATPEESKYSAALFRVSIYFKEGKYFLSFEIRSRND